MDTKTVILIDNDSNDLDVLENVIKEIDPTISCISFVYADEAIRVISCELKRLPEYIFIDVNVNRKTGTECLADLRKSKALNKCQIIMFSMIMPQTVADALKAMGANHAFQKPISRIGYKDILSQILCA